MDANDMITTRQDLDALVLPARAMYTHTPELCYWIGGASKEPLRFELFSTLASVCAQKVRTLMVEKGLPCLVYKIATGGAGQADPSAPAKPDVFRPEYVRLRLLGGRGLDVPLVSEYSGATSVQADGFDACVVPTLVDHENTSVVVDSAFICRYLDRKYPGAIRLWPEDPAMAEAVTRQVEIVDRTPHAALMFGFHPDRDDRPEPVKAMMRTLFANRQGILEKLIDEHQDEPSLVAAYQAKIANDQAGVRVRFDPDFQRQAREYTQGLLIQLEHDLGQNAGDWLFGSQFTMADIVWGVSLVRFKYLGLDHLWGPTSRVAAYLDRLRHRPSLRAEVVEATLQSLPPSKYMMELLEDPASLGVLR